MEKASSRLRVLALLVALMFVALSARLWFLQVLASQQFEQEALGNSIRFAYTDPLRGQIYDAKGRPLVMNTESLEVRITPSELGHQGEAVVLRVSRLTGVDAATIAMALQSKKYLPTQAIPVAEFVRKQVQWYVRENPRKFPGVEVVETPVRSYPKGDLAAQVLGYTGLISPDQYEQLKQDGYGLNDTVGQSGVEFTYEQYLRGKQGKQKLIVNSDGDLIRALGTIPPTAGDDLQLTLDARVQAAAKQALLDGMASARAYHDENGVPYKANAGSVVVLDANTGGVVAMVSYPDYDPSWYVHGLTPAQSLYLNKNTNAPSLNRAIQSAYTPGSTFKPITGLAAVKEGFASLDGYYPCVRGVREAGRYVRHHLQQLDDRQPRVHEHRRGASRSRATRSSMRSAPTSTIATYRTRSASTPTCWSGICTSGGSSSRRASTSRTRRAGSCPIRPGRHSPTAEGVRCSRTAGFPVATSSP